MDEFNERMLFQYYYIDTNADADDYRNFGVYHLNTGSHSNLPGGASNGWLMVLGRGGVCKQVWYRLGTNGTNDHQMYLRTYNNGWSSWHQVSVSSS